MKNWKYIEGAKTGNETLAAHPDSAVAQEIYKIYLDNGKDKKKALEKLSGKYKNIPSDALEKHLDDAIKAYAQMIKNKNVANDDKTGAEEFFKQLSDDVKEREEKDDADIEKVGNAKDKSGKELRVGDIVDVRGKKGKITKIIGDVIEVFYDNSGTYNPDRTDRHYADEATKVGNSAYDDGAKKGKEDKRKGKLITAAGFEYHAPGYSSLSFKEKEEYKKGYYSTNDLKKEDIYKWGNSASDDKFAYVMREFDEGKLKTPDGKVVTDPAQAKAIAYSESKKTENGLARARNAMAKNKKVGNHDFEEGDYVLYNGKKAVVRGFNGSQEVIIEQNGQRITTHWSNLEEYE